MAKTDPELGLKVKEHLMTLGLETQTLKAYPDIAHEELQRGVANFLFNMGLDHTSDDSIRDTPNRVAEMYTKELCFGLNYDNFPKCTVTPNGQPKTVRNPHHDRYLDEVEYIGAVNEMVMVSKIRTMSLCEHHFQTIHGFTHIAYIPSTKLLGLSKFARVTDFFARRPQVQERMTEQIYAALTFILQTDDIAVQQVCVHNCMRARGAMDPSSDTTTSKMGGRFMSNPALRQEFLQGIK